MKTFVHQNTNLEVYTLWHQKAVKIVTNGRCDTVPFPLLYNRAYVQQRSAPAEEDESERQRSGIRRCCNS